VPRHGQGRPKQKPQRVIADKAYDSDPLRERLAKRGIDLICPYRENNKKKKYEDGRKLRRYKRRWRVERTFSWLGNSRRLVVRWDRDIVIYNAFFHVACLLLTLRRL
jgi:transposase